MPRKKLKEYTITSNDRDFYLCLAKTGLVNEELAFKYFKIKPCRLFLMTKNGFLEKRPIVVNGVSDKCYTLSGFGKKWVRRSLPDICNLGKRSSHGTSHDLVLFEQLAMLPKELQQKALTEHDLMHIYGQRNCGSPPDLFIPYFIREDGSENRPFAIEATSRAYTRKHILSKMMYCQQVLNIRKEDIKYVSTLYFQKEP